MTSDVPETRVEGEPGQVTGSVTENANGSVSGFVDPREKSPDSVDVPTVDELAGIAPWYTGDQSSDEFLRAARGGS